MADWWRLDRGRASDDEDEDGREGAEEEDEEALAAAPPLVPVIRLTSPKIVTEPDKLALEPPPVTTGTVIDGKGASAAEAVAAGVARMKPANGASEGPLALALGAGGREGRPKLNDAKGAGAGAGAGAGTGAGAGAGAGGETNDRMADRRPPRVLLASLAMELALAA